MKAAFVIIVLTISTVLFFAMGVDHTVRAFFMDTPYQANRLFKEAPRKVFQLAQKIEWGDEIEPDDVSWLGDEIDDRYGENITLLFHALTTKNLSAIDSLLLAGADLNLRSMSPKNPNFIFARGLVGAEHHKFLFGALKLYLKHGGDPNVRFLDKDRTPLIKDFAVLEQTDSFWLLIEAGADPWAYDKNGIPGNAMNSLANNDRSYEIINRLIDKGYFDGRKNSEIEDFFVSLAGYAQRGDEISLQIQALGKRILKRYPEISDTRGPQRAFKKHWTDAQAEIPWDEINSETVR